MSKSVVVSGYATVDYSARLPEALHGTGTRSVTALSKQRWPAPGGAAFYASCRLAAAGHRAYPLVTLGEDSNALLYAEACVAADVSTEGFHCTRAVRTPWCFLLHHDDGTYTCLIDVGAEDHLPPSDAQIKCLKDVSAGGHPPPSDVQIQLAREANSICFAAAPTIATERLLAVARPSQLVAWIAKNDPMSFTSGLCAEIVQRADVIFCNSGERALVDAARVSGCKSQQIIVETRGAGGVVVENDQRRSEFSCEPVSVSDTTGAGDTLAGEVLAALLNGEPIETAVVRGIDAARSLLMSRG